ncbi:unnamed protein product [marine sediment metagenome]|uniref:Uncharacterized protein n=1 Tax=marine sediment metagenome TaxID=412755 RepID=X0WWL3_9ZZZZ
MPCTDCSDPDYEGTIKVRYIGNKGDKGSFTYEKGRVYTLSARHANKEAYPLFELVAIMPGAVIPEKYQYIVKRVEVPVEMVVAPVVEDEPEPGADEVEEKIPVIEESEHASSIVDSSLGLTQADRITGMDANTLKLYIRGMGGEVDNRWGLKRLIEEAQKLQ